MDLTITLRFDPASLSPNQRLHWAEASRRKALIRRDAHYAWLAAGRPRATSRVVVDLIIHRLRVMDEDNTWAGCKALLDGIFGGQLTPDDSAQWVRLGRIHWRTGRAWAKCPVVTVVVKSDGEREGE